jgi:CRP/FNR family transcriptional regulator, cyclic AMP receptor protein
MAVSPGLKSGASGLLQANLFSAAIAVCAFSHALARNDVTALSQLRVIGYHAAIMTENGKAEPLRAVEIFSGLSDEAIAGLRRDCTLRHAAARELIIGQDDEGGDVLFLLAGTARVSLYSPDGQRVGFRDVVDGAIFGELSALDGKPRSASIEAVQPCTLAVMTRQRFLAALAAHPELALALTRHLTRYVRALTDRIFEFSTLAGRNRLRMELLRLAAEQKSPGDQVTLSPSPPHAEIAARISCQREAVSRELAWLERNGFVRKQGRDLTIASAARLRHLIDEDWKE